MTSMRRGSVVWTTSRRAAGYACTAFLLVVVGWSIPAPVSAASKEPSPKVILERAKASEQSKDYAAAIEHYRRYLTLRPEQDDVRATLAKLLSWQEQFPESASLYEEILTRHPLDDESRVGLARVLSWQKQYTEAQREYERVLQEEPTHVEALHGLADVLVWSGRPEQALPYYQRVLAATGDAEVAAKIRALSDEAAATAAAQAAHDADERRVSAQGQQLETDRKFSDAVTVYREGLRRFPHNDDIRTALARVLSWQGRQREAATLYREVLARHPQDHDVRASLAQVLAWDKQFGAARGLYEEVLQAAPAHVEARRGLAELDYWEGRHQQALTRYDALVAETQDPDIIRQRDAVKAEMTSALPLPPAAAVTPDARLTQAAQLEQRPQYREAAQLYREVLQTHPEDDEVRISLARVLSWQGAHQEATQLYREVLARRPKDQDVRTALAQVLSWQRQYADSQQLYEQVLQAEPTHLEARRGLAELAHWQERRSDALARYDALAAETHDPEIERQLQAVKSELLVSPRAAVGQGLDGLRLPYRDYAKIGYGHYTYTKNQPDERDLLFELAKPLGNQTLVLRVEPLNRFGFHDTPFAAELYSPLWSRAWGYVAAQATINPHFSPNYSFVGEVAQGLGGVHGALAPLEVSFGYRRLNYRQDNIDLLMPGLTIFLPFNLWLTEKIYMIPQTGAVTLASQLTWRPSARVQVFASGSFGTSGERIVAQQDFTRVGSRTIQAGLTFPITERFSAEAAGYYEDRGELYVRRGGNFNLIYHW